MVFTRNGGGHLALYEGEEGNDYLIRGGNQSNAVSLMRIHKSRFTAAMWHHGKGEREKNQVT